MSAAVLESLIAAAGTDPDALDVAADLAEDLGDLDRATELHWRAVLLRCDRYRHFTGDGWDLDVSAAGYARTARVRCPAETPRTRLAAIGREGRVVWNTWEGYPCDPPACAPAVLAALRKALS